MLQSSKVASKSWVTIKNRQSLDAHDVDASGDCLFAQIGSVFGATFEDCHKVFQNSATIIIKKWSKSGARKEFFLQNDRNQNLLPVRRLNFFDFVTLSGRSSPKRKTAPF